jgi:hypothetical protein
MTAAITANPPIAPPIMGPIDTLNRKSDTDSQDLGVLTTNEKYPKILKVQEQWKKRSRSLYWKAIVG